MSTEEKEKILKTIFDMTDSMDELHKNYILGYIRGFEDKSNIITKNENSEG